MVAYNELSTTVNLIIIRLKNYKTSADIRHHAIQSLVSTSISPISLIMKSYVNLMAEHNLNTVK